MSTTTSKKIKKIKTIHPNSTHGTGLDILNEIHVDYSNSSTGDDIRDTTDPPPSTKEGKLRLSKAVKSTRPINLSADLLNESGPPPIGSTDENSKTADSDSSSQTAPSTQLLARIASLKEQATHEFLVEKRYEVPPTYIEVETLFSLLETNLANRKDTSDNSFELTMNAFFKAFTNSQCGNELHNELGDDDRLALLRGVHIVFIKNPLILFGFF